jgi:phosphoenolpyruvate carboxykinase (ATP)
MKNNTYFYLTEPELIEKIIFNGEAHLTRDGALVVDTGEFKGRAANDKFIVLDETTANTVDWKCNKSFSPEDFDRLYGKVKAYLQGRDKFEDRFYAGTNSQLRFHFETTSAWHTLFAKTMFYPSDKSILPSWTLIHAPHFYADKVSDKTNSSAFIILNFTKKTILIGGTEYAGEIKKSIFTVMNYLLPEQGILPMHASVNETKDGRSTIFFGLSGTGKTTLSADNKHILVGDDEHGWDENGLFNFEDGCYAKVINLSSKTEPEIWNAVNRYGTVLENVLLLDNKSRVVDFTTGLGTENTRGAYKLNAIPNASKTRKARHPSNIIMLTCDAYGVLPPVARLSPEQAIYYFLSGYTAKVAGTEAGVTEPTATFSACFGAPFLPRSAIEYGNQLYSKINEHDVQVWLVNTGWTGGPYGVGKRIDLAQTRAIVNAIIDTPMEGAYLVDPNFGFTVPKEIPGVIQTLLNPRLTWKSKKDYDVAAKNLLEKFKDNFQNKKYGDAGSIVFPNYGSF